MNLETLQLFCEVTRQKSFSRGARTMEVTQSAASQAIAALEEQLGVTLIDRSVRPFALTPEGRKYYERVWAMLQDYEQTLVEIRSHGQQVSGTVRVAAIYSVGIHAMTNQIQKFRKLHPQAKVRLEYLRPDRVVEAVLDEVVDLGVLSFPPSSRSLVTIPLRSEKLVFVCSLNHPFSSRKAIEPKDLKKKDFVAFDRDLPIRKAIDRALRKRGVEVNVVMEFDNIENIKRAVELGGGVTILPEPIVTGMAARQTLVTLPLAQLQLSRPIAIIHRRRRPLTPAVSKFVDLLKEEG